MTMVFTALFSLNLQQVFWWSWEVSCTLWVLENHKPGCSIVSYGTCQTYLLNALFHLVPDLKLPSVQGWTFCPLKGHLWLGYVHLESCSSNWICALESEVAPLNALWPINHQSRNKAGGERPLKTKRKFLLREMNLIWFEIGWEEEMLLNRNRENWIEEI